MYHILILSNLVSYTYNFRKEIIEAFLDSGNRVTVVAANDDTEKNDYLSSRGCRLINVAYEGKGTDIAAEYRLLKTYCQIIRQEKPDVVFTYTIKPNLYGGIAARMLRVRYIPMITGLGEVEKPGKLQALLLMLHRIAMPHADCVFFQNSENMHFFDEHGIRTRRNVLLPGSGINLEEHRLQDYPARDSGVSFGFVGRLTPAKGIEQFLDAAEALKKKNPGLQFHVAGKCDECFVRRVERLNSQKIIIYHGRMSDTRKLYEQIHCLVLPTYHPEGISNVLLEAAAAGRPAICTCRAGCREVVEDGYNGFYCSARDSANLRQVMERFIALPWEEKKRMGLNGREKVERSFSRELVVKAYLRELNGDRSEAVRV